MKKYLYLLLFFVSLLSASCSNDDIEIVKEDFISEFTVNYNVSTRGMYETFGIVDDIIETFLQDKTACVGVTTFVYDTEGNLVDRHFSTAFALGVINQSFNLKQGEYTIITVQSLMDPDNNNNFLYETWEYQGVDNIRTLQIAQLSNKLTRGNALGVVTSQGVKVNSDLDLNVSPLAIGSLVYSKFYNFTETTHEYLGFSTNNVIDAYKLDPSLSREDRFYYEEYVASDYTVVRSQIEPFKTPDIYLITYVLEPSIDWKLNFVKAEDAGTGTWTYYYVNTGTARLEDGKSYYTGLYFTGYDTASKSFFGDDKQELERWRQETEDSQQPTVPTLTVQEPYRVWGSSVSSVQSHMNDFEMFYGEPGKAIAEDNGTYGIAYYGNGGAEEEIQYYFTSPTTGLMEADAFYKNSSVKMDDLLSYVQDADYVFLLEESGTYLYATPDMSTYVMLSSITDYHILSFVDANSIMSTKSASPSSVLKSMKAKISGVKR